MFVEPGLKYRHYTLDDFQIEAINHLLRGESVLVSAPTGVGKTLIADYLVDRAIKDKRRVVYTAPIKALSNQKFKEFKGLYGADRVGIITGDVVINPEAELAIMTTEIFRNILHQEPERLSDLSHVIFDEIHYLADEERGTVWEESIIFMPEDLRLLGLSATIPNARELADWIEEIKGHRVQVVYKHDRVVPLEHYLFHPVMGAVDPKQLERVRQKKEKEAPGRFRMEEVSHKALVRQIWQRDGLPCLYFVFSRQQCELKAEELSRELDLLTPGEKKRVIEIVARLRALYQLEEWPTIHRLEKIFLRGVAFHHAGLLPALKEIIETLFAENLIRVMYATETFAVGINYPVRSVCFDAPTKWDGVSFRPMTTLEYFQMAGRAGRRGIDKRGYVYILADLNRYRISDFPGTDPNDIEELVSRFNLSYNSVLNLYKNHPREQISTILDQSFATYQARKDKVDMEGRLNRLDTELTTIREVICADWGNLCCPKAASLARRAVRRKERKLKYIRGRKTRNAIAKEVAELKKRLSEVGERNCLAEEQIRCERRVKKYEELYEEHLNLGERINTMKTAGRFEDDLEAKVAILEELDYLKDDQLLPRGKLASQIYAQELLITELYFGGYFHEWDEDQINAVMVAVDYEPRKNERLSGRLPFDLRQIKKIIRDLIYRYGVREEELRFFPSLSLSAYEWSGGCDFQTLLKLTPGMQEGDIVAAFRRGIDLARQLRAACMEEDQFLASKLKRCMDKMDRDLVRVNL